jgi:hypothetical protein
MLKSCQEIYFLIFLILDSPQLLYNVVRILCLALELSFDLFENVIVRKTNSNVLLVLKNLLDMIIIKLFFIFFECLQLFINYIDVEVKPIEL